MWAKGRFDHMAEFATKAEELGFTHVEANASISPRMLSELTQTPVPIASIHSPCPAVLSSRGAPISDLSLSSLDESERMEAVSFARRTIALAANIKAKAVVLHMGEVRMDRSLRDKLRKLYAERRDHTKEYNRARQELLYQRVSQAAPYLDAAKKSLRELCKCGPQNGIMLGLETRFNIHEIPNMDEMAALLDEASENLVGYWHDVGHAEVQQRLGFSLHEEWLSRFKDRMIGVHLHDILGISDHRAPGTGDMDWVRVAGYLPAGIERVCEVGEWNGEEDMLGVVDFLTERGIASQLE